MLTTLRLRMLIGRAAFSLISLAVAAHTSFYPIILLAPIIIHLGQTDPKQTKKALVLQSLLLFVTSTIAIGVFNFLILGDNWIQKSLGTRYVSTFLLFLHATNVQLL